MKRKVLLLLFFSFSFNLLSSVEPDRDFKEGFAFLLLKNKEEAKKFLEPWISRQKSPLLREAFKALLQDDKILASSNFESFLNQDERNVEALLGYGLSLEEMYPSYQEFYFRQAMKVNPNLSIGRIALGYTLLNQEKIKEAEREILLALKRENFPVYNYLLFNLYINSENWEKAFKVYNEISSSFPKDWTIPLKMGRVFIKKGIRDRGVELLEKAYELNPSSIEILVEIGTNLVKDGKFDEAIKYFERAYSINKNDPAVLKGRGLVLLEKGEFENAHKELLKAWGKRKDDSEISFLLAKSSSLMGKENEAKEWLLRAIIDGFNEWREVPKIQLFKDLTTREKILSSLNIVALPFYSVEKLEFLKPEGIGILGRENKGEEKALFIFGNDGKKLRKITIKEEIKDFFFLENTIFLRTSEKDDTKQNIYIIGKNWLPIKLNSQPIDFYDPFVHLLNDGFLIWDREAEKAVKKSPFSIPVSPTRRLSFYPNISFNIFQFKSGTNSLKKVTSKGLASADNQFIKSFELLEKLYSNSKDFKKIVDKGKALDISSAETIEIFPFPGKGAIVLDERGSEVTAFIFDTDGKRLKEQKFKMDAIYTFTIIDMNIKDLKFASIAISKKNILSFFDLKKKKVERIMENIKKFKQISYGYLILNENGELKELKDFNLRTIKKGVKDFYLVNDFLIYEGFDGWLYFSEAGKERKVFPSSGSLIYNLKKDKGILFSPQAGSIFIKTF